MELNVHDMTCTACGEKMNPEVYSTFKMHIHLMVLICQKCFDFYDERNLKDESGEQKCHWCAGSDLLISCDNCTNTFCTKCIRRNMGKKDLFLIYDIDKWTCYCCDSTPLQALRTSCKNVMEYLKDRRQKDPEICKSGLEEVENVKGGSSAKSWTMDFFLQAENKIDKAKEQISQLKQNLSESSDCSIPNNYASEIYLLMNKHCNETKQLLQDGLRMNADNNTTQIEINEENGLCKSNTENDDTSKFECNSSSMAVRIDDVEAQISNVINSKVLTGVPEESLPNTMESTEKIADQLMNNEKQGFCLIKSHTSELQSPENIIEHGVNKNDSSHSDMLQFGPRTVKHPAGNKIPRKRAKYYLSDKVSGGRHAANQQSYFSEDISEVTVDREKVRSMNTQDARYCGTANRVMKIRQAKRSRWLPLLKSAANSKPKLSKPGVHFRVEDITRTPKKDADDVKSKLDKLVSDTNSNTNMIKQILEVLSKADLMNRSNTTVSTQTSIPTQTAKSTQTRNPTEDSNLTTMAEANDLKIVQIESLIPDRTDQIGPDSTDTLCYSSMTVDETTKISIENDNPLTVGVNDINMTEDNDIEIVQVGCLKTEPEDHGPDSTGTSCYSTVTVDNSLYTTTEHYILPTPTTSTHLISSSHDMARHLTVAGENQSDIPLGLNYLRPSGSSFTVKRTVTKQERESPISVYNGPQYVAEKELDALRVTHDGNRVNFVRSLMRIVFEPQEMIGRNARGRSNRERQKLPLNEMKMMFLEYSVFKAYPLKIPHSMREYHESWGKCLKAINDAALKVTNRAMVAATKGKRKSRTKSMLGWNM